MYVEVVCLCEVHLEFWPCLIHDVNRVPFQDRCGTEAYDLRIHLGAGTAGTMGYHGVNNATGADDDSW